MNHQRWARIVTLSAGRVEKFFTEKRIYLRSTACDLTLAALLRNSCETARSIRLLASSGYGSNALALTRSILDTWITVRWLTNKDSDQRTRRFMAFDSKQRARIIELLNAHYDVKDLRRFTNKRHDEQASEFKRWDAWGPGIKAMANEQEFFDPNTNPATGWSYDVPFFVCSYHLHPTSLGIRHHFIERGDTLHFRENHAHSKFDDEERFALEAMATTTQCLLLIASRTGSFWGVDTDDLTGPIWDRYLERALRELSAGVLRK